MSSQNKLNDQHLKMLKDHFGDSSKSKPNKRPNQKTNKHKGQKRLGKKNILNFPFNGRFIRGNENGFSFIANSVDEDYFAHISNNVGARVDNMKVLDGKECAFIIGGSPFAYNNKKPKWENVVIQWVLLTELKIPDDKGISEYSIDNIRKDYFDDLNIEQFIFFLKAEWYVKLWEKRANTTPKSHLIRDSVIEQALGNKIGECESLKDIEILFTSTCNSYWFEEDEKEISSKYFHPKHWNESIFLSIDLSKVDNYLTTKYKKTIQRKIISKRSIAIDLETDGKSIFQYGWYCTDDKGILVEQKGIKTKQLQDSITSSTIDKDRDIVIGHNINAWDLPILKNKKIKLSDKNNYWDTLIISWLLEPWKQTHALINENNAHQADSDAKVTYQLFTNQLAKLNTILFSGDSEQFDTFKLIEFIFLNPDAILDIVTDFGLDTFSEDFGGDNIIILTEPQLNQMGWNKNLNIKIFDSSTRAANPILDYVTIKTIAEDCNNIFLKLISINLYNASKNNVQIFLSMIPSWLISNDKIKSEIIRLHVNTKKRIDHSNTVDCHLINDILKLGNQARNKVLSKKQITVFDKKELLLYWSNTEKKEIKEKDIEKQYPDIIEQIKGQSLFRINNSDIMSWIFYEIPGLKDMVSHWSFLPPFPDWLNQIDEYPTQDQNQTLSIYIPSWIDGDTSNLALDRIFVSHSTKNRILYLSAIIIPLITIILIFKLN